MITQTKTVPLVNQKETEFMDLNLEPIIYKLTHSEDGDSWDLEKALKFANEYKCWLYLSYLYPNESLLPSKNIDKVWHTHALDTELYELQTKKLFGRFFHHFPYFGVRSEQDKKNLEVAFEKTKVLMKLHGKQFDCGFTAVCGEGCGHSLCDNNACDTNSCSQSFGTVTEEDLLAIRPDRFGVTKMFS